MRIRDALLFTAVASAALLTAPVLATDFAFQQHHVDTAYGGNGRPGWVQAGDMDGDDDLDIVAGGGNALYVYENDGSAGGWTRHGTLDGTGQIGANGGVLYDVDGDGLAQEFLAVLQSGYWNAPYHVRWYRPGNDPSLDWEAHRVTTDQPGPDNNHAGIDVADLDDDGDRDISFSNGWFESSGDPAGPWTWHPVSSIYGLSNSLVRDMNDDGQLDLIVSAGYHGSGLYWLEHGGDPRLGPWAQHADAISEATGTSVITYHENLTPVGCQRATLGRARDLRAVRAGPDRIRFEFTAEPSATEHHLNAVDDPTLLGAANARPRTARRATTSAP